MVRRPHHHGTKIDLHGASALQPDLHQASFDRQGCDVSRRIGAAHHVENNVDAFSASQTRYLRDEIYFTIVDRGFSAERFAGRALSSSTRRCDHMGTTELSKLNGRGADPAGAAVHQEPLTRLQMAAIEHIAPDGKECLGDWPLLRRS